MLTQLEHCFNLRLHQRKDGQRSKGSIDLTGSAKKRRIRQGLHSLPDSLSLLSLCCLSSGGQEDRFQGIRIRRHFLILDEDQRNPSFPSILAVFHPSSFFILTSTAILYFLSLSVDFSPCPRFFYSSSCMKSVVTRFSGRNRDVDEMDRK